MEKKEDYNMENSFFGGESEEFHTWCQSERRTQIERIAEEKDIEDEETLDDVLSKLIYLKNEYIVEGAQLTCSKCTKEPQTLKYKGKLINCNFENNNSRDRIHIFEERTEEINGLVPVNVGDCKGGLRDDTEKNERVNIVSMGNCSFFMEGEDIEEIIRESGCKSNPEEIVEALNKGLGSCYCFMQLNEEWENMSSRSADELMGRTRLPSAGIASILNTPRYMKFNGKEGINMMSMLFCNLGGGFVMALESGQKNVGVVVNVKEKILELIKMENGIELVAEYLDEIKSNNPEYVHFLELLAMREAGGSYTKHNDGSQYLGMYQIGNETFQQIKFKDENNKWTDLAGLFGVNEDNDFLESEIAQEVAILFALRWDYQIILKNQDDLYMGETIEGVTVTNSGLIAAGHLIGCNKLHDAFIGKIAWSEAIDGNKMNALVYMEEMGGLDLSGILGGIE